MASGQDMMAPISLVENDNAQLSVNQEATETIEKISHPVVVVAIVGLYRTVNPTWWTVLQDRTMVSVALGQRSLHDSNYISYS